MLRVIAVLTLSCLIAYPQSHCSVPPGPAAPSLPAKLMDGMGTEFIHFPITTTNPEAQKFFNQGIAQMHSFWGREAERSFLQAAALDPDAPMPWFGVAMIAGGQYQPYFQIANWDIIAGKKQSRTNRRAMEAAQKAIELSQKSGKATELEKLYIAAVAARRIPGSHDPDEGYIAGWRKLLEKFPREVEARTFLSLHLMRGFELPAHTPRETSMEAVSILRDLLKEAPDHPGVHHYVIHGFEGSSFAAEAWPSCKRYFAQAVNIPHALHMPGHIYSQTGRWEDAITAFTTAKQKEWSYIQADKSYGDGHHGHNVNYLSTSYSFTGDYENAVREAQHLLAIPESVTSADAFTTAYSQGFIAMLRTLTQHEKWDEILDGKMLPEISRPRQQAWYAWARGLAWAAKANVKNAKREARHFRTALDNFRSRTKLSIPEELLVAQEELAAQILLAEGKTDRGLRALEQAAKKNRMLRYSEPPYYPRPVYEALGKWAHKSGNLRLAESAYRQALEQFPADAIAEKGLEEIRKETGLTSQAD